MQFWPFNFASPRFFLNPWGILIPANKTVFPAEYSARTLKSDSPRSGSFYQFQSQNIEPLEVVNSPRGHIYWKWSSFWSSKIIAQSMLLEFFLEGDEKHAYFRRQETVVRKPQWRPESPSFNFIKALIAFQRYQACLKCNFWLLKVGTNCCKTKQKPRARVNHCRIVSPTVVSAHLITL